MKNDIQRLVFWREKTREKLGKKKGRERERERGKKIIERGHAIDLYDKTTILGCR